MKFELLTRPFDKIHINETFNETCIFRDPLAKFMSFKESFDEIRTFFYAKI